MKKYIQLYNNLLEDIKNGVLLPGKRLPTESDLAERFSVSRQTVRQALDMLRHEGYIYSVQGSGSFLSPADRAPQLARRIAVITTYFSEYIFPSILRGISQTAVENGYTVQINATNNSMSNEKSILMDILNNPVAGIIVEGTKSALPNSNVAYYQQLAKLGIPIVFINSIYPQLEQDGFIYVVSDDYNGGYQLASRVITEGHTRIGCFFKSDDKQGINRFSGVISAIVDHGIEYDDSNFLWFTTENKHSFLQPLSSASLFADCSAIICYNDEIAAILSSYLKRNPNNIRFLASFDANLNPDIIPDGIDFFSLEHPKSLLGRTAAQKLFNMLAGKDEHSIVMPWIGKEYIS